MGRRAHAQAQLVGDLEGTQPYLKARASMKALLWREKPCSSSGKAVNKLDEPLSLARSMAFWKAGVTSPLRLLASAVACSLLFLRISALADI